MNTLKTLFVLAAALTVAACEYRYRYACQNPENWEKTECKRPACELDGTCPDMLMNKQITEDKVEAVESGEACNCDEQPQGE